MLRTTLLPVVFSFIVPNAFAQCWECCDPLHTFSGDQFGERSGWYVNNAGDTDGDGVDDILLGAPFRGGNNHGRVYLHSGATGQLRFHFDGGPQELLGQCIAGAGDVNGDGFGDLLLGGPAVADNTVPGSVYVVSGADGSLIRAHTSTGTSDHFGRQVESSADLDGDGVRDYLIGAPQADFAGANAGRTTVYSGATGAVIRVHDGAAPGARMGDGVGSHLGDVDQDQVDDYLLASTAAGAGGRGQVQVISGRTGAALYAVEGDALGQSFGWYFTNGTGDLDLDGVPDFFVADVLHNELGPNTGKAYMYSGANGALLYTVGGDIPNANFGLGHPVWPDLDGDGVNELLFGSWSDSTGANTGGAATLFSGATGERISRWTGDVNGALFAGDVATLGDLDGDGAPEVLISAPWAANQQGRSYVYSSRILPPSTVCAGAVNSTGQAAELRYRRSLSLSANQTRLRVVNGPAQAAVMLLMADGTGSSPVGDGELCLGHGLRRATMPETLEASGAKRLTLDFNTAPLSQIEAGRTYYFQAWYRDTAGSSGSNLTNALRIVFCQ